MGFRGSTTLDLSQDATPERPRGITLIPNPDFFERRVEWLSQHHYLDAEAARRIALNEQSLRLLYTDNGPRPCAYTDSDLRRLCKELPMTAGALRQLLNRHLDGAADRRGSESFYAISYVFAPYVPLVKDPPV